VLPPESSGFESVLVTVVDLSARKCAEEALNQAQAALAHVTRVTTLGELTASIAHEVNQPLAAIVNNASASLSFLSHEPMDVESCAALEDITSDAERASAVIERVRSMAKRSPTEPAPAVADVVDDVVALAAAESARRRVAIRSEVAVDLPVVAGDRVQLQQVLLNLVVNAMDAMASVPESERLLEIRARRDVHDGRPAVSVSVRDHGVGLADADLDRLFDAFYSTKPHGMGMGLAISRSIIESHRGSLWAEANRGAGATFSFALPADSGSRPAVGSARPPRRRG
jgi:C4-dicarboxylate-specific signal transduction histidine kinase